jgi:peptidyl-prolyl cis-trans isomerase SurA
MAYFINKFGSESKMEAFYGKRLNVIKDEFRPDVEERMLSERVLQKISGSSKLTPSEVRQFINAIPTDSLPLINSELELQHMVFKTKISTEAKALAFKTISEFRKRVADGISSMSTMCRLYSEDPGSAKDGGFYANVARGTMVPEFDAVAFRLKPGELSQVFETSYGYHFIQLIQRKGDLLDLRHLLIIPKISNSDRYNTRKLADSVYKLLKSNTLDFETAVKRYSEDAETVQQNGLLINRNNASTRFDNDALNLIDPGLIVVLNPMQEGAVSEPMEFMTDDGKPAYRILKLKSRIPPHKANLKDDYPRLYQMAVQTEQAKSRQEWIKTHVPKTYIRINDTLTCKINSVWTSVK